MRRRDRSAGMAWPFASIVLCALVAALLLGLAATGAASSRPLIKVCVSVLPEAFIVDRIGGGRVSVTAMAGGGQSPHAFEPTPALIARLSQSDVCFTLGLPFEKTVLRDLLKSDPALLVFDAATGIQRRPLDPHVWLSPRAAAVIAANVRDGLAAFDPADSSYFDENLDAFERELGELDVELAARLAPFAGGTVYVFHPAYGYFTDEYGLHQVAIEVEGKEPSPRDLAHVISEAKRARARVIFVQPEHPARIAQTVAHEIGARVVVLDPLAYDYFGELRKMAVEIEDALSTPEGRADHPDHGVSEGE